MRHILFLVLFLSVSAVGAQDILPTSINADPSVKDLRWHRWETTNFVIMSLDEKQGQWLFQNLESINKWVAGRWDMPAIDYPHRIYAQGLDPEPGVMVLCVPDRETMRKLWKRETPYHELRRNPDGKIYLHFIVLIADQSPSTVLPGKLTEVYLQELGSKLGVEFSPVFVRGMSALNEPVAQIRHRIGVVGQKMASDDKMFFSKALFGMTNKDLQSADDQLYDSQAMVMCLMLRREFGKKVFEKFVANNPPTEDAIRKVYRFDSFEKLDAVYKRYIRNLSEDVKAGKTPDSYLQIQ